MILKDNCNEKIKFCNVEVFWMVKMIKVTDTPYGYLHAKNNRIITDKRKQMWGACSCASRMSHMFPL